MATIARAYNNPGNVRYEYDMFSRMLGFGHNNAKEILNAFGHVGVGSRGNYDRFDTMQNGRAAAFGRLIANALYAGNAESISLRGLVRSYEGSYRSVGDVVDGSGLPSNTRLDMFDPQQMGQFLKGVTFSEDRTIRHDMSQHHLAMYQAYRVFAEYGNGSAKGSVASLQENARLAVARMEELGMVDPKYHRMSLEELTGRKPLGIFGVKLPSGAVRTAQEYLTVLGHDPKGIDGAMGTNTATAMDQYLHTKGQNLPSDQLIGAASKQFPEIYSSLRQDAITALVNKQVSGTEPLTSLEQRVLKDAMVRGDARHLEPAVRESVLQGLVPKFKENERSLGDMNMRVMQGMLQAEGLYKKRIDGITGAGTRGAVKGYEAGAHKLEQGAWRQLGGIRQAALTTEALGGTFDAGATEVSAPIVRASLETTEHNGPQQKQTGGSVAV